MSDSITLGSYAEEISSIARDCAEQAEGDLDSAMELAHESVDGHQWIIYNRFYADIIACSDNENAVEDFGGGLDEAFKRGGVSAVLQLIAFCAMLADVQAEISDACDTWTEKQEAMEAAEEAAENLATENA